MVPARWKTGAAALLLLAAGAAWAAEEDFRGEVILKLEGAFAQNFGGGRPNSSDVTLLATYADGRWQDTWASAMQFNRATHDAEVLEHAVEPGRMKLKLKIAVRADKYVAGGEAEVEVDLERRPSEGTYRSLDPLLSTAVARSVLAGTHRSVLRQQGYVAYHSEGRAVGILLPVPKAPEGFRRVGPDERPRLLFRKADLPALKARARTPLGKAIVAALAKSDDLVAKALLYRLTDERAYAERAVPGKEDLIPPTHGPHVEGRLMGFAMWKVSIAYDLCGEAWPDDVREKVRAYLRRWGEAGVREPELLGRGVNQSVGYWGIVANAGGGLAILSLWGQKGPEPARPNPMLLKLQARSRREDPDALLARKQKQWQQQYALWKEAGEADMALLGVVADSRRRMEEDNLLGVGEGGMHIGEGYTQLTYRLAMDYAIAYQNMFGRAVSSRPDISHFAARHVMTTAWLDDEASRWRPLAQGFGGSVWAADRQTLNLGIIGRSMRLCPPAWRPVLLWFWLRSLGTTAAEMRTAEGVAKAMQHPGMKDPDVLVHSFVNYPLELEPVEAGEVMPRVWESPTHGLFVFRNGWRGRDSIVAQVFAGQGPVTFLQSGSFQILGLGHEWVDHVPGGFVTRGVNNVVLLPHDKTNIGGHGLASSCAGEAATGSGSVTMNLADVYRVQREVAARKTVVENRGGVLLHRVVVSKGKRVLGDGGIRGLRSFAADYSGEAGAAGLFVVVDQVTGGMRKEWLMHLADLALPARGGGEPAPKPGTSLEVKANTFTVRKGQAVLRGTFVAPVDVQVERLFGTKTIEYVGAVKGGPRPVEAYHYGVRATGPDGEAGDFFLVMTLARGDPPQVKVQGEGLKAVATVGRRTIRFDGEKVVVGR